VASALAEEPVEVAAAVILRRDREFLLAQRPVGKPYAGYWEFPGGKAEPAESVRAALTRELREELGIEVTRACPWIMREYVYPHAHVRLNFFRVLGWNGEPRSREAQPLSWQRPDAISVGPLLPANGPVLRALALPPVLAITDAWERGEPEVLDRLDAALEHGLRMVMVREKQMPRAQLRAFATEVLRRCARAGALVLVNSDVELARTCGANGVHLTSTQLQQGAQRPDLLWCGASCHNRRELERAVALGLDYVVLGPVLQTLSHSDADPLGWTRFAQLVHRYPLPVYALGGVTLEHFGVACNSGAQGVAMVRGAWTAALGQAFPSGWSDSASPVQIR
jgi:8-oxo-dGTP diphosphatase